MYMFTITIGMFSGAYGNGIICTVQQYVQHSNITVVKSHSQALWSGTFYHIIICRQG